MPEESATTANAESVGQPTSETPLAAPTGYALEVKVNGETSQEAWWNLLDVMTYAIECKNAQEGLWPHMVSTNGGKITVKAHTNDSTTQKR
jgi:hypothetical protein